jgi:hypothetical protein
LLAKADSLRVVAALPEIQIEISRQRPLVCKSRFVAASAIGVREFTGLQDSMRRFGTTLQIVAKRTRRGSSASLQGKSRQTPARVSTLVS